MNYFNTSKTGSTVEIDGCWRHRADPARPQRRRFTVRARHWRAAATRHANIAQLNYLLRRMNCAYVSEYRRRRRTPRRRARCRKSRIECDKRKMLSLLSTCIGDRPPFRILAQRRGHHLGPENIFLLYCNNYCTLQPRIKVGRHHQSNFKDIAQCLSWWRGS